MVEASTCFSPNDFCKYFRVGIRYAFQIYGGLRHWPTRLSYSYNTVFYLFSKFFYLFLSVHKTVFTEILRSGRFFLTKLGSSSNIKCYIIYSFKVKECVFDDT